jgi:hypothetical protein
MPNNITNIIRADQDVLDALCTTDVYGKKTVDFNTVVPMPDSIHTGSIGLDRFNDPTAWRRWSIDNWGTKWNAYGQRSGQTNPDELRFETAWSHPEPIINALCARFPDREIQVAYADEDTGYNLGVYAVRPGPRFPRRCAAQIVPGTPEATNLAHLISTGESHDEYGRGFGDDDWSEELDYTPLDDHYDPFDLIKEH